jgi:16S rRNA (guanine527-N7)-methyltransferase
MLPSLADSLDKHRISLPKVQVRKLGEYCGLLWDWNERINLTRHTDYEKFVARDVVDSLALAEFLRTGERILDVGTGGGVPGVILAILRPDLHVELCDSTGKKALAVSEMVQALRLDIPVHHAKAETLLSEKGKRFTTLTIRAVSRMVTLLRCFAPCWSSFDRMLLVKGPKWTEERGESRHYNLMTKIALRCVKTYSTQTSETETVESVVLQLCLKENFEQLDKVIDGHLKKPQEHRTTLRRNTGKMRRLHS